MDEKPCAARPQEKGGMHPLMARKAELSPSDMRFMYLKFLSNDLDHCLTAAAPSMPPDVPV
ncbi:hypothetical protein E2C01_033405 [Portunus trituberculatus]|uniref:Uncharacterized protein n=1 Tax=Portunus trituberculatus TaxID=210409 RepID=A0A5B7F2C7_PORTR|nr:hypothetical protein [Portunus trituberculatus]